MQYFAMGKLVTDGSSAFIHRIYDDDLEKREGQFVINQIFVTKLRMGFT